MHRNQRIAAANLAIALLGVKIRDTETRESTQDAACGASSNVITNAVTENASEGTDTVNSAIAYTLGTKLENLTLTGSTAINGTGNTLVNVLRSTTPYPVVPATIPMYLAGAVRQSPSLIPKVHRAIPMCCHSCKVLPRISYGSGTWAGSFQAEYQLYRMTALDS